MTARVTPARRCTDSCNESHARVWTRGTKLPCAPAGRAYRAVLANLGVPPGDLAWAIERVESGLLRTVARSARALGARASHADAASELPIAGLIDGDLCEAVIDRTFIDENGVRWIIDYKTSAHEGAGLENFLEAGEGAVSGTTGTLRAIDGAAR